VRPRRGRVISAKAGTGYFREGVESEEVFMDMDMDLEAGIAGD
jgi:hypothetical protein